MPTLKMVAPVLLILALTSCAADPEPGTWQRGTAKACDSCTSDLDCAAGLLCDQDSFACKSVEQLKAKKVSQGQEPQCDADCWYYCMQSGGCQAQTVTTSVGPKTSCSARSVADCQASVRCKEQKQKCNFSPATSSQVGYCVD